MHELVTSAIAAHGGLDRWNQLSAGTTHIVTGGALWDMKGQDGVISDSMVRVDLHRQFTSHSPFGAPDLHDTYTPDRVTIETKTGKVLEERQGPRGSFAGHALETPWDRLHLAYFSGYAMWTYLTQPFSWADPGVTAEELEPVRENGEHWRRLRVVFPSHIATHSLENLYYLDDRSLIRRHDYTPEVLGGAVSVAHFLANYREFDGIMVPTRRRVHLLAEDGSVVADPVIVSIDLDRIQFR